MLLAVQEDPPRFIASPSDQEVELGGSTRLTCEAVGSPVPYIKWMRGPVDLNKKDEMPQGRNVLEVINIRKSAIYTCVATSVAHGYISTYLTHQHPYPCCS